MRRVVILCTVPLLIIAASAAGVYLSNQQQQQDAGPNQGAILPSTPATPSPESTPSTKASGPKGELVATKAMNDCRREVARAESVLEAAGDGVTHWREHVQAQTDLSLGRNSLDETKAIWKRTKLAGPSDVAKYETAKAGYKAAAKACQPVQAADEDQAANLKTCRTRLDKVRASLAAADRVIDDWADHLADMRKSAAGHVHNAQEVWMNTWRAAPPNLDKYAAAVDTLAKTKSCPH